METSATLSDIIIPGPSLGLPKVEEWAEDEWKGTAKLALDPPRTSSPKASPLGARLIFSTEEIRKVEWMR